MCPGRLLLQSQGESGTRLRFRSRELMLTRIIDFSLHHRFAVIAVTLIFTVLGLVSLSRLDVDAFPDITPVQIQVNTVVPQLNPEEVEQRVTYPVEQALAGMPHLESVRSLSKFGLSQVVVTFREGTDLLVARQLINERLATVVLPPDVERPKMGPMSNGLGEVFHYVILSYGSDRTKGRTVHEWVIRPQLRAVPGVAEINSWGGFQKQYQVRIDPTALVKYNLTFDQVVAAIDQNNRNVGGGTVHRGGSMLLVHGIGRVTDAEELRNIVVASHDGQPVYLRNVGEVGVGDDGPLRRGAVTFGGRGEVNHGLGFMTVGENSHTVTTALREKLKDVETRLPRDVEVVPVYDRTELIDVVVDTATKNLFEGGLLVVAVLFAFLGNLRAAFIVALAIPLSMMFAFTGMYRFAISASLLSLGAIDFGMIVDSSVVMVENCVRKSAEHSGEPVRGGWRSWFPFYIFFADQRIPREIVRDAAVEVRQPTLFGELIILVVYLPVLTLEGIEGKLFRPMALTVIFALAGSMLMSVTLMPVLASLFLPRQAAVREPMLVRWLKAAYAPVLHFAMRYKLAVLALAAAVLGGTFLLIAPRLGEEYVPELSEGAFTINVIRPVGTSLDWSIEDNTRMEKALLAAFPDEVRHVWSRVGAADVATDPMGTELTDLYLTLHPRSQWTKARNQQELAARLEEVLRAFPGSQRAYSQPIAHRIGEVSSGARGEVVVSVFGDDLTQMTELAQQVKAVLESTHGAEGVYVQPSAGQPVLRIRPRPKELAHHGISAKAILDLVEANGGKPLGEVVEGQTRFPLVALLPRDFEGKPDRIRDVIVSTSSGERIPLYRLADVDVYDGPPTIHRERGQRRLTVTCNVVDRDLAGFVEEARAKSADIQRPEGGRYTIEWGGQYEQLQRAKDRLWIVRGLALFLVAALLYLTYGNVVDMLRVLVGIPFALVGGVIALWLRDMPFSISAQIGFVAVAGVAVLDDMILVSTIRQLRQSGLPLDTAVERAAMIRLRPVLMTTLVASLGFVPMAFSTGQGAEVQRPLATVVIGGVISALVMSLLVLRVLYVVLRPKGGSGKPPVPSQ
jgi:cobalt-zinc-cadmium resistance protein CzcA